MTVSSAITIANASDQQVELWLEPWGDFVPLAPGAAVRVLGSASEPGEFEVVWRSDGPTVYAWPTCAVRVFGADGSEVKPDAFWSPVPAVPRGTSVRSFLRVVLGE